MVCMIERALASFLWLAWKQTNKHTILVRDSGNTESTLSYLSFGCLGYLQALTWESCMHY